MKCKIKYNLNHRYLRLNNGLPVKLRGVAQFGSAPALGAGGRGFESLHPDQNTT
jgi:hypothetical protein